MNSNRHWLDLPHVSAPSPEDRTKQIRCAISPDYVDSLAGASRLTPIFQLWTHVVGELPPINNASRLTAGPVVPTLTTLVDAIACFRGVKRPYDDEPDGSSVLIYVLNPSVTVARDVSLVCMAKAVVVPSNACLTVQMKPTAALQRRPAPLNSDVARSYGSGGPEDGELIHGVVMRLEFVSGNGGTPILPSKHEGRYLERLWQAK